MENFDTSHLVEELQLGCKDVDIFPVLIGTKVVHFHSVEGDYPNEDYKLVLKVTGYKTGPQSFSEALTAPIDKRETRYEL